MQIDISSVEFDPTVLALHHLKALTILAEERPKYRGSACLGEPFAYFLDDSDDLYIAVPVYCCRAHMEDDADPIAHILIDRIPPGAWVFRQKNIAQA